MELSTEFTNAISTKFKLGSSTQLGLIRSVTILSEESISVKIFGSNHDHGFIFCPINKLFLRVN